MLRSVRTAYEGRTAGTCVRQGSYQSFQPTPINRTLYFDNLTRVREKDD